MDRREFTALLGAGVLFPGELLAKATTQPSLPKETADDIQYYPIYYMRAGSKDVYQLWQPGIIMGVCGPSKRFIKTYRQMHHAYRPEEVYAVSSYEEQELSDAIRNIPAHGLIVDDGFGRPYNVLCWEPMKKALQRKSPLLLPVSDAEYFVAAGNLCRCQPFCTYEEYLDRNFLEKIV